MYDLNKIKENYKQALATYSKRIIVCAGTGCIANGALKVHAALQEEIANRNLHVDLVLKMEEHKDDFLLSQSGCQGFCQVGPLVRIEPDGVFYVHVKPADAAEIIAETIVNNVVIDRLLYANPSDGMLCKGTAEIPFYAKQSRTILAACGSTDPHDIREYISNDGYASALKAHTTMEPAEIVQLMKDSGLRGRGGGGFPTGLKWEFALKQDNEKKYIICNADEGDPGAFMDRSVMEGNPHSVIEGMMIAARAIGSDEGYIYVRAEYPLAVQRIKGAIADAKEYGILGDNVFGTGRKFEIIVMEGAGAFVCGEETALIASLSGERGYPKPKPPFPAVSGLNGKPTIVNNVETLASVPYVLQVGVENFRSVGTEKSPGTKTFALTGQVVNTGLIEVPFGSTLRQIVFEIGGGILDDNGNVDNSKFKAVQIGGPSGGCLTEEHLDLPLDFDSLSSVGAMVGSGGLVVLNQSTCIVKIARFFMQFTQNESCGKCVPCREGTRQMLALLDDIIEGNATEETINLLEKTARVVKLASLCGLGKSAPSPVLSTLRYFREEYMAHVKNKVCLAGQCKALTAITIDPELCKGCTLCKRTCPVGAIEGEVKKAHKIDPIKCIKCQACVNVCKFKAISGGSK